MTDLHLRALLLGGLAAFGVIVALVGASLGVGGPVAASGPTAAFDVSERNVTVSDGDREVTVVDNMSAVRAVEIAAGERDGEFTVRTETEAPLTAAERERAVEIARDNATVQRYLDELGEYELAVEPIKGISADSVVSANLSGTDGYDVVAAENATFAVESGDIEVEDDEDSVTIREQTYVEDDVYVEIRRPGAAEPVYEVQVDLAAERVVVITE